MVLEMSVLAGGIMTTGLVKEGCRAWNSHASRTKKNSLWQIFRGHPDYSAEQPKKCKKKNTSHKSEWVSE